MNKSYVYTTKLGIIPYLIHTNKQIPLKIHIDDFIYKDSEFLTGKKSLKEFINATDKKVYVDWLKKEVNKKKGTKKLILSSKRGQFGIDKQQFDQIIVNTDADGYFNYETKMLKINNIPVVEPKDLDHFNELFKSNEKYIFGTGFISKLISQGYLVINEGDFLSKKHINDTDDQYMKYLYKINETNVFLHIAEQNYQVFDLYFK
ncbi:hypothetical protein NUSPORA_02069 [Nucleospora cyclopteri]